MKKFRVGIVGMGFIGIAHIDALRRLGNVEIAAVCDAADLSAKQNWIQDVAVYKDYHEMFAKEKLDAVHICTPNRLHFPVAMEALNREIAVVCEKPFTWSLEEAEQLSEIAEKKNIPNFINYCNRFYPVVREMRSRIKKGELGDLILAEGGYRQDCLFKKTDFTWRMLSENSGKTRVVADLGSHWFDLVEHLSNKKITAVLAQFKTQYPVRMQRQGGCETFQKSVDNVELKPVSVDTEDIANVLFRMEDGAVGNAMFSQMCAGRKNELWINLDGTQASFGWNLEKPEECMIGRRGEMTSLLRKDAEIMEEENLCFAGYPAGHTEGFVDAISHGFRQFYGYFGTEDEGRVYADFRAGCRSMLLAEKIYESTCKEQWISL